MQGDPAVRQGSGAGGSSDRARHPQLLQPLLGRRRVHPSFMPRYQLRNRAMVQARAGNVGSVIASPFVEASSMETPDVTRCPLCERNHYDQTRPRGTRVLVVEDDSAIAALIAYNLERSGYRVTVAADGVEALRRLREAAPDLVVL